MQDEFLDPVTKQWSRIPDGLPLSTYSASKVDIEGL
jgi:hypothetical protein